METKKSATSAKKPATKGKDLPAKKNPKGGLPAIQKVREAASH